MKINRSNLFRTLVFYSPVIIGLFLMLPRLLSPQFGFFDDATTLTTSENILNGTWNLADEAHHGRFRPTFWLYYALIYAFAGKNPFWFFLGNLFLLSLITVALIRFTKALGFNQIQSWFAVLFFVFAASTLENAYTLSKPELQQVVWLILSLLCIGLYVQAGSRWKKILSLSLASLAIFVACSSKETTLVMLPISFALLLISWLFKRLAKSPEQTAFAARRAYLIASLIGVVAFLVLRSFNLPYGLIERGYPSHFDFSRAHIIENARIWINLLLRDYLYLIPLALPSLLLWLFKRDFHQIHSLLDVSVWMLAWTSIYIPWQHTQEYYLLPFAMGAAIFGAILLEGNLTILRQAKIAWRVPTIVSLALAIILFLLTIPSLYSKVRAQLAVDASNDEMLTYVLENSPENGVVLINIQDPNEYVGHFKTLVNVIGERADLQVEHFQFQDSPSKGWNDRAITIVSPVVENQFYPSMRMGVFEMPSRTWNQSLLEYMGDDAEPIHQIRHSFRSALINTPRAICFVIPSLRYCIVPHSPIDNRVFAYGWDIYRDEPAHDE